MNRRRFLYGSTASLAVVAGLIAKDDRKWSTDLEVIEKRTDLGWQRCRMAELKKGDVFRMRDLTCEAIEDPSPEINHDGLWTWGILAHILTHPQPLGAQPR